MKSHLSESGGAAIMAVGKNQISESTRQAKQGTASSITAGAGSCVRSGNPNLTKLAEAIASRVGPQRFHVWFDNSTRLDLRNDGLEICVPNDFIGEWIGQKFTGTIQEAAVEVFGGPLNLRFQVVPELFEASASNPGGAGSAKAPATANRIAPGNNGRPGVVDKAAQYAAAKNGHAVETVSRTIPAAAAIARPQSHMGAALANTSAGIGGPSLRVKLRHTLDTYIVGASNQLAFNAALHVAEFPGTQYNPLFIHGACGLGKTHLLQGLCNKFIGHHPTRKWLYCTGEEFTNDYLAALRLGKVEAFRRRMRDLDLLIIDDVHFLAGKKATQEEFLHTFNAIEALGKQVVMASDSHPKEISEFGESLVNRFVSGMVVRVDPPNVQMRIDILKGIAARQKLAPPADVLEWVARRVTQNVRELEGAITRIAAHVMLTGGQITLALAQEALGDLDRAMGAPVKPENVLAAVAQHFGIDPKDLMSGRRHHTVSLARSVAMYLIRKTAKLSYPEIGHRLGKRNHSTVISACRRIDAAVSANERLTWSGALGDREEEATELVQRLEEHARALA